LIHLEDVRLRELLEPAGLVEAIRNGFNGSLESPTRMHQTIPGAHPSTLLIMPAWQRGGDIGIKLVTVDAWRGQQGGEAVNGVYVLLDGASGGVSALLDARVLTAARTAAVSALASSLLAREDASTLLMIGTGNLAAYLVQMHRSVRNYSSILVWGRDLAKAQALAARLQASGGETTCEAVNDLAAAVARADTVCCATASAKPLVHGGDLAPGTHVDLIGSFTPAMREADDDVFRSARVIVDTYDGMRESGDLLDPVATGALDATQVRDLAALLSDAALTRRNAEEITVFKAVGSAIADLAVAQFFLRRHHEALHTGTTR
jgi:ornithine cyclodeaminase/alanine dehydrogenase-like protein (mu-crystallin family)